MLGLTGQDPQAIWTWFQERVHTSPVPETPEDRRAREELEKVFAQSEIDRQRVKKGVEAMKREQADLRRAREEAEKLSAEAI